MIGKYVCPTCAVDTDDPEFFIKHLFSHKYREDCRAVEQAAISNDFLFGFAIAISSLARHHDLPSVAADIAACNGVTYKMLKDAGVESYDLAPLRREMRLRESQPKGPSNG